MERKKSFRDRLKESRRRMEEITETPQQNDFNKQNGQTFVFGKKIFEKPMN